MNNLQQQLLVVDDEPKIRHLLKKYLSQEGYSVEAVSDGSAMDKYLINHSVDLVILDLMLPGEDGLSIGRRLRDQKNMPIIILSARSEELDKIIGLEMGADDYITKPFRPKILLARIKTALRRKSNGSKEDNSILIINGIKIDHDRHEVELNNKKINLSVTEFSILEYLAQNPGYVYSRNKIIDRVKGNGYAVSERSVDVQILGIRRKLGETGKYIETVRGIGYRLLSS